MQVIAQILSLACEGLSSTFDAALSNHSISNEDKTQLHSDYMWLFTFCFLVYLWYNSHINSWGLGFAGGISYDS